MVSAVAYGKCVASTRVNRNLRDGCLLGVVGKVDLLRAFAFGPGETPAPYDEILRRPVASVMDRAPETVTPGTRLTALLERMIASGRCSFPVVIRALVVGVITRSDVTRALRRSAASADSRPDAPRRAASA